MRRSSFLATPLLGVMAAFVIGTNAYAAEGCDGATLPDNRSGFSGEVSGISVVSGFRYDIWGTNGAVLIPATVMAKPDGQACLKLAATAYVTKTKVAFCWSPEEQQLTCKFGNFTMDE